MTTFEELASEVTGEMLNEELAAEEVKSQEEVSILSSAFAEQLANVQTQLMALSHLPKTIQSTLDEITKQLQSLIPPSKLKQKSIEPENKMEEMTVTCEGKLIPSLPDQNRKQPFSLSETNVQVEQPDTNLVEVTSEHHTIEQTTETVMGEKQKQEESSVHPTRDEIVEYEESQAKFRVSQYNDFISLLLMNGF